MVTSAPIVLSLLKTKVSFLQFVDWNDESMTKQIVYYLQTSLCGNNSDGPVFIIYSLESEFSHLLQNTKKKKQNLNY